MIIHSPVCSDMQFCFIYHDLREKLPENGHCCHEASRSTSLGSKNSMKKVFPKTLGTVFFLGKHPHR